MTNENILHVPIGTVLRGKFRYQLEQHLGSGAFASVYQASCLEAIERQKGCDLPPRLAIKVLTAEVNDTVRSLLKREVSSLLALKSSRIPSIFDWSIDSEYPFVAMELYHHGTMQQMIQEVGEVEERVCYHLLRDLLRAANVAHRAGLLHLDIKPANVLLDGKGGFVLSDFGISQAVKILEGKGVTPSVGTPFFRAPEQARIELEKLDARTDLYGIGATVWRAYTGGKIKRSVADEVKGGRRALPPSRSLRKDGNKRLCTLIDWLIEEDLTNRPGSAAQVLAELNSNEPEKKASEAFSGSKVSEAEAHSIKSLLVDPLWSEVFANMTPPFYQYQQGHLLCQKGDLNYNCFILISGQVQIERDGKILALESREGTILGEVAALSGTWRTASVRAREPVVVAQFNASEFESLLAQHPAISLRVIKSLSERLVRESRR